MITAYLFIVWIGAGNSQSLSIQSFDSRQQCEAALATAVEQIEPALDWVGNPWFRCVPYTYED